MAEAQKTHRVSDEMLTMYYNSIRGNADDLRAAGGTVAVHNDYRQGGELHTFWQITFPLGPDHRSGKRLIALIGEGKTDAEALDQIRAAHAEMTDFHHHAPLCPANHFHGARAPTGPCNCGAVANKIMMVNR